MPARRLHGPGQFVADFTANVGGGSYTFSNPISGNGGLVKQGGGTLTLSGANTYTGGTTVEAGTLGLSGSLGSSVAVKSGATFASMGGRITGTYTADAGANTAIQLGTGLKVSGSANLDGSLTLLPEPSTYTVKATETLLTAGAVNGTFDAVKYGSGFFWNATVSYTATQVNAALTRASAAKAAAVQGSDRAVVDGGTQADVLIGYTDTLVESGNIAGHEALLSSTALLMASPDRASAEASLASLTGEIHGTARTLGMQQALNDGRLLAERVNDLAYAGGDGVWLQATGADGTLRRDGYASADYRQSGMLLGVDRRLSDSASVGAALTQGRNRADLDALGGRLDGQRTGLAAYGRMGVGANGYVSGSAGYDRLTLDTQRTVVLGSSSARVQSRRDDAVLNVRIEGGVNVGAGLTPFASVGALRHRQGAFSEAGAGGLGLSANSDVATAAYADIGVRYFRKVGDFAFGANLSQRRMLSGTDAGFNAWFTGAPDAPFAVAGQPLSRNVLQAGVQMRYSAGDRWVWFADVGGEQANGQSRSAFGALGVKIGF